VQIIFPGKGRARYAKRQQYENEETPQGLFHAECPYSRGVLGEKDDKNSLSIAVSIPSKVQICQGSSPQHVVAYEI
jgi:hypothetical protein